MNKLVMESSNYDHEYYGDCLEDDFNDLFDKVFKNGDVGMLAENHGWRGLNGHLPVQHIEEGIRALHKCFGNGNDISFEIYERRNSEYGHHIAVTTAHHDVPMMGQEWSYLLRPSQYNKNVEAFA